MAAKQYVQKEKAELTEAVHKREIRYHLWGWVLFLVCALFFIASSLRNGDILMLFASVVFLAACLVFIVPLIRAIRDGHGNQSQKQDS